MLTADPDSPTDTARLHGGQGVFGQAASEATISRLIHQLADDSAGLAALGTTATRRHATELATE